MTRVPVVVAAIVVGLTLAAVMVAVVPRAISPASPGDSPGDRSLLDTAEPTALTGSATTVTSSIRTFDRTVRIGADDVELAIDETPVTCHGGLARVTWHIGNLEPTTPDTGIRVALRLDGEPIGGMLRGSEAGIYEDAPASMVAVIPCPRGEHIVDVEIVGISGYWGFPYVANVGEPAPDGLVVGRGIVISEVWG